MTPGQTFDPRDPWQHARRIEVYRYSQEKGIAEIVEAMPKDVMVKRLKALGIPPPSVPRRPIGATMDSRSGDTAPDSHHFTGQQKPATAAEVVEADATDVLERDWLAQQASPAAMTINQARDACKLRGIKMARTDKLTDLKAKLEAHGRKDPP